MASAQIDMDKVVATAGAAMGAQVWRLTVELEATREALRVTQAQAAEGETETADEAPAAPAPAKASPPKKG